MDELRPHDLRRWLPGRHNRVLAATLTEDLTAASATSCARRYLATPLHEISLRRLTATALAKAKENSVFRIRQEMAAEQVHDGRQDHQEEIAQPPCDGGA